MRCSAMQRIEAVYSPRLPDIVCEPGSVLSNPVRQIAMAAWFMQSPCASPIARHLVATAVSAVAPVALVASSASANEIRL